MKQKMRRAAAWAKGSRGAAEGSRGQQSVTGRSIFLEKLKKIKRRRAERRWQQALRSKDDAR